MLTIDYFLITLSPYCYLTGRKLEPVAARHGARIRYRPFALLKVFEKTGTAPVQERHPSRQEYRLKDIARVAAFEGVKVNPRPFFWPTNPVPSCAAIIAAQKAVEAGAGGDLGGLVQALLAACWAENRDIAEDEVVADCLTRNGFDPALVNRGLLENVEEYDRNTTKALEAGVFGAPSFVVEGEVFWGQDRLPHLDAFLAGRG